MMECLEQSPEARPDFVKILKLLACIKQEGDAIRVASLANVDIVEP